MILPTRSLLHDFRDGSRISQYLKTGFSTIEDSGNALTTVDTKPHTQVGRIRTELMFQCLSQVLDGEEAFTCKSHHPNRMIVLGIWNASGSDIAVANCLDLRPCRKIDFHRMRKRSSILRLRSRTYLENTALFSNLIELVKDGLK